MDRTFLVDKPAGWTSFDVVAKVRHSLRSKYQTPKTRKIRVGHAGTLDPFATGLLIVLAGAATKRQSEFMKLDKEYEALMILGKTSSTGDPEGEITEVSNQKFSPPKKDQIWEAVSKYIGKIEQIPPQYSAIKIGGRAAYKYAREGKKLKLSPRPVMIYRIEILRYRYPDLKIRVSCSSGTYIRTLAEDIGRELGCGAFLKELRRTKVGEFSVNDALSINETLKKI